MQFPYMAILAAGVAAWVFGAVWYTALSKPWQRALGLDPEACKGQKMPLAPMAASLLGAFVMATFLSQLLLGLGVNGWMRGAWVGLLVGVGFPLASTLVNNMFQQKKPLVTVIDGAHWVVALTIQGAILGLML